MNVFHLTLAALRVQFLMRCGMSFIQLVGYSLLFVVDWRIALGVLCVQWAVNIRTRVMES